MLLSAATTYGDAVQPLNGLDSRAPSTPFAVTMEQASFDWKKDFLNGLQQGLGYRVVPLSDAQTPNAPVMYQSAPNQSSVFANPLVGWGLLAAVAFLVYKNVR